MKGADGSKVYSMSDKPWWGWDAAKEEWGWTREKPASQVRGDPTGAKATRKKVRVCVRVCARGLLMCGHAARACMCAWVADVWTCLCAPLSST